MHPQSASGSESSPAPSRDTFDENAYLALNPDVAAAIANGVVGSGWQHYTLHGAREGRRWLAQPDRLAGVKRDISPQDEMFSGNEEHYFDVGESALRCIDASLRAAGRDATTIARVLDLPCGHGRVLRFLKRAFAHAEFTACDLNRSGVTFCAQTFGATPVVSDPVVERIALSAGYDLIWCGSLLTHLPEARCREFLELFHRVLAPGGVAVWTLHGRQCERELAAGRTIDLAPDQVTELLAQYRRTGFGYVDYADERGYGFSVTHPAVVTGRWLDAASWRLVSYQERGWDRRQDVIALQKPA